MSLRTFLLSFLVTLAFLGYIGLSAVHSVEHHQQQRQQHVMDIFAALNR